MIWFQFVEVGNELLIDFSVVLHSDQTSPGLTRKLSAVSKRESVEYYLHYVHNRGAGVGVGGVIFDKNLTRNSFWRPKSPSRMILKPGKSTTRKYIFLYNLSSGLYRVIF